MYGTTAGFTVFGAMHAGEAEIYQRVDVAVRNGVYGTAPAAIATIRAALGNIFFTPEAGRAITAVAGNNFNLCFVYEFHLDIGNFILCPG